MKLIFSKDALNDFKRLHEFIALKNLQAAKRISCKLTKGIRQLLLQPESGKQIYDSPNPDKFREIYILDYHIRYMFSDKTLMILRVWHQKEDR